MSRATPNEARVWSLLRKSDNTDASIELLGLMAKLLRSGGPIPEELANHVAAAFEALTKAEAAANGKTALEVGVANLIECFGLKKPAMRPKIEISLAELIDTYDEDIATWSKRLADARSIDDRTVRARIVERLDDVRTALAARETVASQLNGGAQKAS